MSFSWIVVQKATGLVTGSGTSSKGIPVLAAEHPESIVARTDLAEYRALRKEHDSSRRSSALRFQDGAFNMMPDQRMKFEFSIPVETLLPALVPFTVRKLKPDGSTHSAFNATRDLLIDQGKLVRFVFVNGVASRGVRYDSGEHMVTQSRRYRVQGRRVNFVVVE